MDRLRYRTFSRQQPSLHIPLFFILLVSLSVFVLITPTYTGFATSTPQQPQNATLLLDRTIYLEGETVTGDFDVFVPGPLSQQTLYTASLSTQQLTMSLSDALNASGVSFQASPPQMTIQGSSDSKTLVFPGKGSQQLFLSVPQGAVVSRVGMNIHGQALNGSFPSFVRMDIGMDGSDEWEYFGDIINYSNYILPSGLQETVESTTFVKDEDAYYCEIISLPRAKSFHVLAKYAPDASALAANLDKDIEAVLLSLTGSGATVQGAGGADVCDLPESTNTTPQYQSCNLSVSYSFGTSATVSYAVQGDYLVCVHNEEYSTGTLDVYNLRRDSDKGAGYRCASISQGKTSCIQQLGGDFYIKVQAALYDGLLDKQVVFDDGYTELIFEDELNNYIKTCQPTNGNCVIPLRVSSNAAGIVYLDQLKLRYDLSGSSSEENNFYAVSFTPGVIYQIDAVDLTQQNTTLSLSVDALNLVAPDPGSTSKNFTLTVALSPGAGDSETLLVQAQTQNITSNTTQQQTSTQELIDFYESILSQLLQQHNTLLTALQYSQKLTQATQQLSTFEKQLRSTTNGTNASSSSIDKQIQILMQSLPQSITLPLQSTHDFTVTYSDLTDAVVLPEQRDETSKKKIYTLQQSVSITGNADTYEIMQFDKTKEDGTLLQIQGSSPFGDGYVVLLIPSSLAGSLNDITFSAQPEVLQQANPVVVRWQTSQLAQGVSLLFKDKTGLILDDLRAAVIPRTIPEEIPQERAQCGDGVCTVMDINGRIIPLEDQYSCPVDCSTSMPWTTLIIVILLFVLAIAYFGFYHGTYSFQNLTSKGKTTKGKQQSLFTTPTDELNLRKYIVHSLQRGQQKDVLVKNLLKQGWTQQQIDAIFKTLQQR